MSRKIFIDEAPEEKSHKRVELPFDVFAVNDLEPQEVTLKCAGCQEYIVAWPFQMSYYGGEEYLPEGKRVHEGILHAIADHKCSKPPKAVKKSASGPISENEMLGIFDEPRYGYQENLIKIQARLDEIYQEPAWTSKAEPNSKFFIGQTVINVDLGHIWKIETREDLETITEGYKNGKRNIVPYL